MGPRGTAKTRALLGPLRLAAGLRLFSGGEHECWDYSSPSPKMVAGGADGARSSSTIRGMQNSSHERNWRSDQSPIKGASMSRSSVTFLTAAAVVLLSALAVAGCGGGSAGAQAAPPGPRAARQPRSVSWITVTSARFSSTRGAAPSICSRRTRGRRARASALAPPPGRRSWRTGSRQSVVERMPQWSEPPLGPTERPRSPTTATRFTSTSETRTRRYAWPGPDGVRRRLVRTLRGGKPGVRPRIQLGRRLLAPRADQEETRFGRGLCQANQPCSPVR